MKQALKPIAPDIEDFIDRETADGWVESRNLSGGGPRLRTGAYAGRGVPAPSTAERSHAGAAAAHRVVRNVGTTFQSRAAHASCAGDGRGQERRCRHFVAGLEAPRQESARSAVSGAADAGHSRRPGEVLPHRADPQRTEAEGPADLHGDSTEGFDQFVWAHKVHFYRTETPHYDWQYTFGFLASVPLYEVLRRAGKPSAAAHWRTSAATRRGSMRRPCFKSICRRTSPTSGSGSGPMRRRCIR